jgi:hypothetical protein
MLPSPGYVPPPPAALLRSSRNRPNAATSSSKTTSGPGVYKKPQTMEELRRADEEMDRKREEAARQEAAAARKAGNRTRRKTAGDEAREEIRERVRKAAKQADGGSVGLVERKAEDRSSDGYQPVDWRVEPQQTAPVLEESPLPTSPMLGVVQESFSVPAPAVNVPLALISSKLTRPSRSTSSSNKPPPQLTKSAPNQRPQPLPRDLSALFSSTLPPPLVISPTLPTLFPIPPLSATSPSTSRNSLPTTNLQPPTSPLSSSPGSPPSSDGPLINGLVFHLPPTKKTKLERGASNDGLAGGGGGRGGGGLVGRMRMMERTRSDSSLVGHIGSRKGNGSFSRTSSFGGGSQHSAGGGGANSRGSTPPLRPSSRHQTPSPSAAAPSRFSYPDSPSASRPSSPKHSLLLSSHMQQNASPKRPSLPASKRTYGGASRSMLASASSSSNLLLSHSSIEPLQESYTTLAKRWGVNNAINEEDDSGLEGAGMIDLPTITELRARGENQRFLDDLGYIVEGLSGGEEGVEGLSVRRPSYVAVVFLRWRRVGE